MSYRGSIYDHQFHIRPKATTTFGETIAMYLAQYFDLHSPQRGAHGQQLHFFTLHGKHTPACRAKKTWLPPIFCVSTHPSQPIATWMASAISVTLSTLPKGV